MTKQVQRRRGTSTQHTSFTGAEGEISVNTTNKSIHVHDGTTAGGVEAARADLANVSDTSLNNALSGNTLASLTITSADINGGTIDGTTIGGTSPAAVTTTSLVATTADINGGTVDGAVIGGSSAAAITGTTITATGDVTIADKIVHAGDTNTAIRFPAADTVTVETAGTERLRVDSSGKLLVGTTGGEGRFSLSGSGGNSTGGDLTLDSNASYSEIQSYNSKPLYLNRQGNNTFLNVGGGNVGIGTSSPNNNAGWTTLSLNSGTNGGLLELLKNGTRTFLMFNPSGTSDTLLQAEAGNDLRFATAGTERLRIDSLGNVGIGTSSPGARLEVAGETRIYPSSGAANLRFGSGGSEKAKLAVDTSSNMIFETAGSERARISSDGRVQIASTNNTGANVKLVVGSGLAASNAITVINTGDIDVAALELSNWDGATTSFGPKINFASSGRGTFSVGMADGSNNFDICRTWGTPDLRIDSSGNLLVGRTSQVSTEKFSVESSGDTYVAFFKGGSSAQYSQGIWNPATSGDNLFTVFATEGSLTPRGSISYNRAGGLVAYNVTSDYRAKDIAGAISDASSTVLSLKPYMGTMKGAEIARPMFVAHETQEIAPYAVTGQKDAVDNDGNAVYQQMDHSALVPLLTAALQEALTEIASLKGRLDAANL
jgi:hypothetical protein